MNQRLHPYFPNPKSRKPIVPNHIIPISDSPDFNVPTDQKPETQMPEHRKPEFKNCPRARIGTILGHHLQKCPKLPQAGSNSQKLAQIISNNLLDNTCPCGTNFNIIQNNESDLKNFLSKKEDKVVTKKGNNESDLKSSKTFFYQKKRTKFSQ